MKTALVWAGRILALLSLIGLLVGWVIERDLASKSGTYQLVKSSKEGALFGDAFEKIGTPQTFVVLEPSAVIEPDEDGTKRLNEDVLKEKGVPPLQLKTVSFVAGISRLGFGSGLVLGILMAVVLGRAKKAPSPT